MSSMNQLELDQSISYSVERPFRSYYWSTSCSVSCKQLSEGSFHNTRPCEGRNMIPHVQVLGQGQYQ